MLSPGTATALPPHCAAAAAALSRVPAMTPHTARVVGVPQEVLADISHKTWIKFPLFFELRNPATSTRTYSGVLEFSAPEGTVLLPDKVIASLNATSTPEVVLRYADLPKATFVQFQPLTADFLDIPDHKAVMESVMRRRFATLTKGTCRDTAYVAGPRLAVTPAPWWRQLRSCLACRRHYRPVVRRQHVQHRGCGREASAWRPHGRELDRHRLCS